MFQINEAEQLETEETIVKYMQSTLFDVEYKIKHHWKTSFSHPHQYIDHPAYQDKRMELQRQGHSTQETLGFLLLPSSYKMNNFLPILNEEFVNFIQQSQFSPKQTLGKTSDGVSLYKSVDVLLKSAASLRWKAPKIAVYKVMPGRGKTCFCDPVEDITVPSPPDEEYDSFSLDICSSVSPNQMDLRKQLMFSEIFVYDYKVKGDLRITRTSPRQATPVTLVCFLPLRPFIIPRPIVLIQKKKYSSVKLLPSSKCAGMPKKTEKKSICSKRGNSWETTHSCSVCTRTHTYHKLTCRETKSNLIQGGGWLLHKDPTATPREKCSSKGNVSRKKENVQSSGQRRDVISAAARTAGLLDEPIRSGSDTDIAVLSPMSYVTSSTSARTKSSNRGSCSSDDITGNVDQLLSSIQDKSIASLCKDAGLFEATENSRELEITRSMSRGRENGASDLRNDHPDRLNREPSAQPRVDRSGGVMPDATSHLLHNDPCLNVGPRPSTIEMENGVPTCFLELSESDALTTASQQPVTCSVNCNTPPAEKVPSTSYMVHLSAINDHNIFDILGDLLSETANVHLTARSRNTLCDSNPCSSTSLTNLGFATSNVKDSNTVRFRPGAAPDSCNPTPLGMQVTDGSTSASAVNNTSDTLDIRCELSSASNNVQAVTNSSKYHTMEQTSAPEDTREDDAFVCGKTVSPQNDTDRVNVRFTEACAILPASESPNGISAELISSEPLSKSLDGGQETLATALSNLDSPELSLFPSLLQSNLSCYSDAIQSAADAATSFGSLRTDTSSHRVPSHNALPETESNIATTARQSNIVQEALHEAAVQKERPRHHSVLQAEATSLGNDNVRRSPVSNRRTRSKSSISLLVSSDVPVSEHSVSTSKSQRTTAARPTKPAKEKRWKRRGVPPRDVRSCCSRSTSRTRTCSRIHSSPAASEQDVQFSARKRRLSASKQTCAAKKVKLASSIFRRVTVDVQRLTASEINDVLLGSREEVIKFGTFSQEIHCRGSRTVEIKSRPTDRRSLVLGRSVPRRPAISRETSAVSNESNCVYPSYRGSPGENISLYVDGNRAHFAMEALIVPYASCPEKNQPPARGKTVERGDTVPEIPPTLGTTSVAEKTKVTASIASTDRESVGTAKSSNFDTSCTVTQSRDSCASCGDKKLISANCYSTEVETPSTGPRVSWQEYIVQKAGEGELDDGPHPRPAHRHDGESATKAGSECVTPHSSAFFDASVRTETSLNGRTYIKRRKSFHGRPLLVRKTSTPYAIKLTFDIICELPDPREKHKRATNAEHISLKECNWRNEMNRASFEFGKNTIILPMSSSNARVESAAGRLPFADLSLSTKVVVSNVTPKCSVTPIFQNRTVEEGARNVIVDAGTGSQTSGNAYCESSEAASNSDTPRTSRNAQKDSDSLGKRDASDREDLPVAAHVVEKSSPGATHTMAHNSEKLLDVPPKPSQALTQSVSDSWMFRVNLFLNSNTSPASTARIDQSQVSVAADDEDEIPFGASPADYFPSYLSDTKTASDNCKHTSPSERTCYEDITPETNERCARKSKDDRKNSSCGTSKNCAVSHTRNDGDRLASQSHPCTEKLSLSGSELQSVQSTSLVVSGKAMRATFLAESSMKGHKQHVSLQSRWVQTRRVEKMCAPSPARVARQSSAHHRRTNASDASSCRTSEYRKRAEIRKRENKRSYVTGVKPSSRYAPCYKHRSVSYRSEDNTFTRSSSDRRHTGSHARFEPRQDAAENLYISKNVSFYNNKRRSSINTRRSLWSHSAQPSTRSAQPRTENFIPPPSADHASVASSTYKQPVNCRRVYDGEAHTFIGPTASVATAHARRANMRHLTNGQEPRSQHPSQYSTIRSRTFLSTPRPSASHDDKFSHRSEIRARRCSTNSTSSALSRRRSFGGALPGLCDPKSRNPRSTRWPY